ncbi:MAG: NUDIX domain-containing protein, partial [Microbacteriaceae bacterium]
TTFEMLKRADSIAVIAIDNNDQIVTIDEEQPNGLKRIAGLPVGSSESYDLSILDAAKREFVEETGLIFRNWRLLAVRQPEIKIEFFVNIYVATDLIDEIPQNLDPGEKITVTRTDYETLKRDNPYQRNNLARFDTVQDLRQFVEEDPEH